MFKFVQKEFLLYQTSIGLFLPYTLHAPSNDASDEGGSIAAKTCKIGTILKGVRYRRNSKINEKYRNSDFSFVNHVNLGVGHSLQ